MGNGLRSSKLVGVREFAGGGGGGRNIKKTLKGWNLLIKKRTIAVPLAAERGRFIKRGMEAGGEGQRLSSEKKEWRKRNLRGIKERSEAGSTKKQKKKCGTSLLLEEIRAIRDPPWGVTEC